MDRRTMLAIVLFLGVWWAYFMVRPMIFPPEVPPEGQVAADTDTAGDGTADAATDPDSGSQGSSSDGAQGATEGTASDPVESAPAVTVPERTITWTACGAETTLTSQGGYLRDAHLSEYEGPYDVTPIYMYVYGLVTGGDTTWKPYGEPPGPQPLATKHARLFGMGTGDFDEPAADTTIQEQADGSVVLRGTTRHGIQVTRTLRERDVDGICTIEVEASWHNPGGSDFEGDVWLQLHDDLPEQAGAYDHVAKPY